MRWHRHQIIKFREPIRNLKDKYGCSWILVLSQVVCDAWDRFQMKYTVIRGICRSAGCACSEIVFMAHASVSWLLMGEVESEIIAE